MLGIRFISALLFAIVAIIVVYAGFWFVMVTRTEQALPAQLSEALGSNVTIGSITRHPDPRGVFLTLNDVVIEKAIPGDIPFNYRHEMHGGLDMKTEFFGDRKFVAQLPTRHTVAVIAGRAERRMDLHLVGGSLVFSPKRKGDVVLAADSMSLNEAAEITPKNLAATAYSYITRESGRWRVSLNDVAARGLLGPRFPDFDGVTLEWNMRGHAQVAWPRLLGLLVTGDEMALHRATMQALDKIASTNATLQLHDASLRRTGMWVTLSGEVDLTRKLGLDGSLVATTNNPRGVFEYLQSKGYMGELTYDQRRLFQQLLEQNSETAVLKLSASQGTFLMQDSEVGYLPPVSTMLGVPAVVAEEFRAGNAGANLPAPAAGAAN